MPLALSSGAGAGGRIAIGTGVIGGMLSATILGIFFVPVFFVVVRGYTSRKEAEKQARLMKMSRLKPSLRANPFRRSNLSSRRQQLSARLLRYARNDIFFASFVLAGLT